MTDSAVTWVFLAAGSYLNSEPVWLTITQEIRSKLLTDALVM